MSDLALVCPSDQHGFIARETYTAHMSNCRAANQNQSELDRRRVPIGHNCLYFLMVMLSFLEFLCAIPSVAANHYYVSTRGSDSNPCSQDSPCLTVQHAIGIFTLASDGAVIHVAAGTYTDSVDDSTLSPACEGNSTWFCASRGGTSAAPLTIQCDAPNYGCVANPGGNESSDIFAEFTHGSYITLSGFEYGNHPGAYLAIIGYAGAPYPIPGGTNISIIGNYMHDVGQTSAGGCPLEGMVTITYPATGWVVSRNKIVHFGDDSLTNCYSAHGIYAGNGAIIQNNIIARVPAFGIQLYKADCNNLVTNNVIFNIRTSGIILAGGGVGCSGPNGANTITNNIIVNSGGAIYQDDSMTNHSLYANNMYYGNSDDTCKGCTGTVTGNITSEAPSATFVNYQADGSGNYNLRSGSLAIGGGTTAGAGSPGCTSACAPTVDFDGSPRPSIPSTKTDIGAYEYGSSAPAPPTMLRVISVK
jgi:hypothetical protein